MVTVARRSADVTVANGEGVARVSQWTLDQHRELGPLFGELLSAITKSDAGLEFAELYTRVESQLMPIVRESTTLPDGIGWGDLMLEDGLTLVQAVWEVNVKTAPKGSAIAKLRDQGVLLLIRTLGLLQTKPTSPKQPDSPFSPAADTAHPNGSARL